MSENNFTFTFNQADLDSNVLRKSLVDLGIEHESIVQIYDENGDQFDLAHGWNGKTVSVKWENGELIIDFSPIAPINGTWKLIFDRCCSRTDSGDFIYYFNKESLNGDGKLIRNLKQLGLSSKSIVQIYDNENELYDPSASWNNQEISVTWGKDDNGLDAIIIDFSPIIDEIEGVWHLKFDSHCGRLISEDKFVYRFGNGSLKDGKLIRSASALGVSSESVFQIYNQNDELYDIGLGWNDSTVAANWNGDILTIDFTPVIPLEGEWKLKFDKSCIDQSVIMGGGGYAPREVSSDVNAEPNDLIICLEKGTEVMSNRSVPSNVLYTVTLPEGENGTMIKVSTQNISGDIRIVPFDSNDNILGDSEFIIGYSWSSAEFVYSEATRTWRVITPQISMIGGATGCNCDGNTDGSGYIPVEINSDYTAKSNDYVICDSLGLTVTLPMNRKNGTMIKVSTQDIGGAKIITEDDAKIGDGFIYYMNPSSVVEFVFNEQKNRWTVVQISGNSSYINENCHSDRDDSNDCIAHLTNIRTRENFKDWIYRKLGWPLVSIELTDEMLDDCINDSILELSEYAYQNRKFYAFKLEDYKRDVGIELPIGVTIVTRVSSNLVGPNAVGAGKIDNYMNDLIANGAIGFPILGRPAGSGWVNYELAMSYLEFSQKMLGGDYDMSYDPRTRILQLWPDPIRTEQKKGWIVVECQCMRPDDQQFGDNWVKRMALAQAKIVLGRVRTKFTGVSLPGGGQVNADDKQEGIDEATALRDELRARFPIANVFMY